MQNEEQDSSTIWQRIQKKDQMRAKDRLYKEYGDHKFKEIVVDINQEPELYKFVEETKARGPKFSNYSPEILEQFAQRIYELRKN